MTRWLSLLLAVVASAFGGCEAVSSAAGGIREKIGARNEGRTKSYAASPRAIYEAVRLAAGRMGYVFVRGGAAQGELEAVSAVATEGSVRAARQIAMKVRVRGIDAGTTQVTVRLTEILEADSSGRTGVATEAPLRDTPQYEVFFRSVQQALDGESNR